MQKCFDFLKPTYTEFLHVYLRKQISAHSYWHGEQAIYKNTSIFVFSSAFADHWFRYCNIDPCIIYNILPDS